MGAAIARAAVRECAEAVVVTGRRREPGEKLVAELAERGATARFVQADVGDVAQAQAAVADRRRRVRPRSTAWSTRPA